MRSAVFALAIFGSSFLQASDDWAATYLKRLVHKVDAQGVEIELLRQRIENDEAASDAMQQEVRALVAATRETTAVMKAAQQDKSFEKHLEKVLKDLKMLKEHINDNVQAVNALQQALKTQEEFSKQQGKQIVELEKALRSLAKLHEGSSPSPSSLSSEAGIYRVKSGDSLGGIAKEHKTTVQILKELNGLSTSVIHPGQELKLP